MTIVNSASGVVQPMSIIVPFAAVMLSAIIRELIDEIVKRKHDYQQNTKLYRIIVDGTVQ